MKESWGTVVREGKILVLCMCVCVLLHVNSCTTRDLRVSVKRDGCESKKKRKGFLGGSQVEHVLAWGGWVIQAGILKHDRFFDVATTTAVSFSLSFPFRQCSLVISSQNSSHYHLPIISLARQYNNLVTFSSLWLISECYW